MFKTLPVIAHTFTNGDSRPFAKASVGGVRLTLNDQLFIPYGTWTKLETNKQSFSVNVLQDSDVKIMRKINLTGSNATDCYLQLLELAEKLGYTLDDLAQIPIKFCNPNGSLMLIYKDKSTFPPSAPDVSIKSVIGGYIHNKLNVDVIISAIYTLLEMLDPAGAIDIV